jgi:hypothetical protein
MKHLTEKGQEVNKIKDSMKASSNRRKRGLLGKLLTSVFGVNDEVYRDIDSLQENQNDLIQSSNHQTKFMISALATFNETEKRITTHLERFKTKLNQGIKAIEDMQKWYSTININKLNIHLLSSYQLALNFIEELNQHYAKLFQVLFNHGTLYDLLPPAQVRKLTTEANKKLPSNLKILTLPILDTKIEQNEAQIQVFGYFIIAGTADFQLAKVIPTPLKIEDGFYWTLDIANEVLAVDYNN